MTHPSQAEKPYECRATQWTVSPQGELTYSEMATDVRITDEAGGEYVEVCQSGRIGLGKIVIDPDEWPTLRAAIDLAIGECKPDDYKVNKP